MVGLFPDDSISLPAEERKRAFQELTEPIVSLLRKVNFNRSRKKKRGLGSRLSALGSRQRLSFSHIFLCR